MEKIKEDLAMEQISKDMRALKSWLDKDVDVLIKKHSDFLTHIVQGDQLKKLYQETEAALKVLNLPLEQQRYVVHLLELLLWFFHLSICATLAGSLTKNDKHLDVFTEISNHLFGNFFLLVDNMVGLLNVRFESFNVNYANMLVYSIVKNSFSFYKTYCSWFEKEFLPTKISAKKLEICIHLQVHKWPICKIYSSRLDEEQEKDDHIKGWERVCRFLKVLRNETEHKYNKKSSRKINLKDFDPLLEVDYRENPEYHPKIGNKVHKYPLAILVLFRFLLKDQAGDFDVINKDWFSCNGKIFDQFGNVNQV